MSGRTGQLEANPQAVLETPVGSVRIGEIVFEAAEQPLLGRILVATFVLAVRRPVCKQSAVDQWRNERNEPNLEHVFSISCTGHPTGSKSHAMSSSCFRQLSVVIRLKAESASVSGKLQRGTRAFGFSLSTAFCSSAASPCGRTSSCNKRVK